MDTRTRELTESHRVTDLRERMVKLETSLGFMIERERQANYQAWHGLHMRINSVDQRISENSRATAWGLSQWTKVLVAIILFLTSYAITGDKVTALRTATMPLGLGH